jgi:hypothetical protein
MRTSEILRGILTSNPGVRTFSVKRILASIGSDRFDASLMMFALPAIVPMSGPMGLAAMPTGAIAYQMLSGQKQIRLPRFILRKRVTRRALAVAIHAALPVLEAAEKLVQPRWAWVNHAITRRLIGLFVFLLAVAIAFPLFGFSPLHATSIFVIALGMAEQDGVAVMVGVVAGVISLAIIAASGVSARAVRAKAVRWLRKVGRKVGLSVFANVLETAGYKRLAGVVTFEWSQLLMMWDPERVVHGRAPRVQPVDVAVARTVPHVLPSSTQPMSSPIGRELALRRSLERSRVARRGALRAARA